MRSLGALCAAIACAVVASPAFAQGKPSYDPAMDVQLLQWAIGPKTFLAVADGQTAPRGQLTFDAIVTYFTNPFVIYQNPPGTTTMVDGHLDVVRNVTAAQLAASYSFTDRIQLGAALPVLFDISGAALDAMTNGPGTGGLDVTGIGDLRIELKGALWSADGFRLGGIVGGTLATSDGSENSQFTGDNTPTARARLALDWTHGRLSLAANGGGILRDTRVSYGVTLGSQVTWGTAAAYRVTEHLSVIGEAFGAVGLVMHDTQNPTEVDGAVRVAATSSISVIAGGGAGLAHGVGSPGEQIFLAVGYAPDLRDSDGDGIPNTRDHCPNQPEDKDGFQDADGCPDDDNDGDRIPDATDKCPDQPEDLDGFQDEDGCPDLDNDKDGIPDVQDKCPNEPEDGKPPFPHDGCPFRAAGSDDDATPDGRDGGDGTTGTGSARSGAGAPDGSAAGAGELDAAALVCAALAAVDQVHLDGDRLIVDVAPALDGDQLAPASAHAIEQLGLVMSNHREVTKWLLAVTLPKAAEAKRFAELLKAQLVARGVTAELAILDRAGPPKLGGAVQDRDDRIAPPACPAGGSP